MVSLSKLLDKGLKYGNCEDVFHPGRSCTKFGFSNTLFLVKTCAKYFAPIAGLPLIMKGRNIKQTHIRDAVKYYIEMLATGFIISQTFPLAICGTRRMFRRYSKYSFVYIPTMISLWAVFFTSHRVARLYATSLFQVAFEAILRNGRNPVTRTIGQSKRIQTIIFMMCSAFVLHTRQKYGLTTFWIVQPIPGHKQGENTNKCAHEESCSQIVLKELSKTMCISILLDLIKALADVTKENSFKNVLNQKLLSLDFPTALFLSSYTVIYRFTSCQINRNWNANPQIRHIIAAFLGGSSFYFLSRYTILSFGISVCIEIIWELFKMHNFENDHKILEIMKQIPFHRFYSTISAAYMVHMFVFRPHLVNSLGTAIIAGLTANQSTVIRSDVLKFFKSLEK